MESLEFIAVIATFAVILFWYLQNAQADADASRGLFALREDPAAAQTGARRKSYRIKPRAARRAHELRDLAGVRIAAETAAPTYRIVDRGERMRRKFRRQDEARYRVKDKIPG